MQTPVQRKAPHIWGGLWGWGLVGKAEDVIRAKEELRSWDLVGVLGALEGSEQGCSRPTLGIGRPLSGHVKG